MAKKRKKTAPKRRARKPRAVDVHAYMLGNGRSWRVTWYLSGYESTSEIQYQECPSSAAASRLIAKLLGAEKP